MTTTPASVTTDIESDRRRAAVEMLHAGDTAGAIQAVRDVLLAAPSTRSARTIRRAFSECRARHGKLRSVRVALLSSYSSEFIHDHLVTAGLGSGLGIDIYQAAFGTFQQEILNPDSGLYRYGPDVVILAVDGPDWFPAAYSGFLRVTDHAAAASDWRRATASLFTALRQHSTATMLVHNFASPSYPALGISDLKSEKGQRALLQRMNDGLGAMAREYSDIHIVDIAGLVARHGANNWHDARMRHYARVPIASAMQPHLASEYVKFLRASFGLAKKCLVVDLDGTLWGGVLGEEGPLGVALGPTYPGSAYVAFQDCLLDLRARGVILAVASKNNPTEVDELFVSNRAMKIDKKDFAAMQIHWRPKSESIANIATELGIGVDHIVFADDNPAECAEVRKNLPGVTVICLPPQPERYVDAVQAEGLFDTLATSDEDLRRGDLYRQRTQAKSLLEASGSLEDYYRDLNMVAVATRIDRTTLPRTSQLTQKTNQFNATTRRYNEAEILLRVDNPAWLVMNVAVRDRFGDNGIVGVVMAENHGEEVFIDTLLLSCRVIGRTVETVMLSDVCRWARERGARAVRGVVVPTAKNMPVRDVFERHGFEKIEEAGDGTVHWRLDLDRSDVACPPWFQREDSASTLSEA